MTAAGELHVGNIFISNCGGISIRAVSKVAPPTQVRHITWIWAILSCAESAGDGSVRGGFFENRCSADLMFCGLAGGDGAHRRRPAPKDSLPSGGISVQACWLKAIEVFNGQGETGAIRSLQNVRKVSLSRRTIDMSAENSKPVKA
jgi:hypothetical protein